MSEKKSYDNLGLAELQWTDDGMRSMMGGIYTWRHAARQTIIAVRRDRDMAYEKIDELEGQLAQANAYEEELLGDIGELKRQVGALKQERKDNGDIESLNFQVKQLLHQRDHLEQAVKDAKNLIIGHHDAGVASIAWRGACPVCTRQGVQIDKFHNVFTILDKLGLEDE